MVAINFKHLMYFRAVAHDGNLTRAAAKLNLSQSALSVQIRALEKRFGHELFERKGRALRLTEAGRIALDGADAIFAAGEEVAAALAGAGIARSELRVGALATLSRNFQLDFLRPALARGDVRITLRSGGEAELLGELAALNLDVVLLNHPPGRDVPFRLVTHRLAHQRVALVGIRKRVRGERNAAALLAREPIILPTADSGVRAAFDALADRLGVVPRIAAEVEDMAMMRLLAREGVGLAVLPPIAVKDELASGALVEAVRLSGLAENFYAVTVPRRFPNPALRALLRGDIAA
jgi:LysR family transcriptional activator of nhaA